jgi:dsRNA-specific ribonuclease
MTAKQEKSEAASNVPHPAVLSEEVLYKRRLHEYCQKLGLLLPVYETVNKGGPHLPQFTTTVTVDGSKYLSPNFFRKRKAAENDAAKIAYTALPEKIKSEAIPIVYEDTIFCKSTLREFGMKKKLGNPTYTTTQLPEAFPVFSSTVNFNGVSYSGDVARTKKEAEQLAARAALISIINTKEAECINNIIRSKSKLYSILNLAKKSIPNENDSSKAKEVENCVTINNNNNNTDNNNNDNIDNNIDDADDDNRKNSKISEVPGQPLGQPTNLPASYPERVEYRNPNPKPDPSLLMSNEALASTGIVFVPPVADPALIPGTSENKKRSRKQRNKENKRKRLANQAPLNVAPLNQVPPCSVSQ